MSPEERDLLTKSIKLSEENNKMLRRMRRNARFAVVWKIFYWAVIIGLSYGTYVYFEPYIKQARDLSATIQKDVGSIQDAASKLPETINGLLKK